MKKIILIAIFLLWFPNFSFAEKWKTICKIYDNFGEKKEYFSKYKMCDFDEEITFILEKNWNYAYFIENIWKKDGEKSKIKFAFNDKILYEVWYENLPIAQAQNWDIIFSKYWNHVLSFIRNFDEIEKKDLDEYKKIAWIYLNDKKIIDFWEDSDNDYLDFFDLIRDSSFEISYEINEFNINFKIDWIYDFSFSIRDISPENFKKLQKILNKTQSWWDFNKDNKQAYKESHHNKYFLEENERKNIDNFLNNFLSKKENIWKIDDLIKKIKEKQKFYIRNSKEFEILYYLKTELKIYKLKNF